MIAGGPLSGGYVCRSGRDYTSRMLQSTTSHGLIDTEHVKMLGSAMKIGGRSVVQWGKLCKGL